MKVQVYNLMDNQVSEQEISDKIFVEVVNEALISQALRVYEANMREGNANSKTRGEINATTKKIYKQKGTGRARHGSKRAPIFVGGGVVHGPRKREYRLDLPKTMRIKALSSALTMKEEILSVISGVGDFAGKTRDLAVFLEEHFGGVRHFLIVVNGENGLKLRRAAANLPYVRVVDALDVNAWDVVRNGQIMLDENSLEVLEGRISK
jgi:large subunit ribosomal protein L4